MTDRFITRVSELTFHRESAIPCHIPRLFMCDFSIQHFHPHLYHHYGICYPDNIRRAVTIRQAEFLAGRYIAGLTLERSGVLTTGIPIGANREPIWPSGVAASLSHHRYSAVCLAAYGEPYRCAGVDIESIVDSERLQRIKAVFCSPEEEALLRASCLPYEQAMTLLFSAKESLFKALYPQIRRFIDFSSATITDIDPASGHYTLMLAQPLSAELFECRKFSGRFCFLPQGVITLCYW